MKKELKKTRNYNIDFLRGIATICIIIIHTAWWSGTGYLPTWFSNLMLLIDVPVFMFISGISFNYVNSIIKNLKGLLVQWNKWIYFIIFYIILYLLLYRNDFAVQNIFSWLVYLFPENLHIQVVGGSIWFMIMYIKVTIICSIIICAINHYCKEKKLEILKTVILLLLMTFCYCSFDNKLLIFDSYTSFYSLIYILGYTLHNYKIKDLKQLIVFELSNIIILILVFLALNLSINDIQNIKFPPSIPYLFFSLISIILFWYLKDNLNIKGNNKLVYVGKTAIFFYFAQGVSSSFIYNVYPYIPFENIALKFICMLISNIVLATLGAVFLDKSYNYLKQKMTSNKEKISFMTIIKSEKEV